MINKTIIITLMFISLSIYYFNFVYHFTTNSKIFLAVLSIFLFMLLFFFIIRAKRKNDVEVIPKIDSYDGEEIEEHNDFNRVGSAAQTCSLPKPVDNSKNVYERGQEIDLKKLD